MQRLYSTPSTISTNFPILIPQKSPIMKKPVKRILIVSGIVLAHLLVLVIIMIIRYSYSLRQMSPADTQAINDTVFCIRDKYVNAYVFKGFNGYLMIDAGMNEDRIIEELAKLEIDPDYVMAVILTHSDPDHTGGLDALKNASVYMHTEEEQMVTRETARFVFKGRWKHNVRYDLFESDDIINVDVFQVRVIHTPGHTPGSCCFIVNDDYLLTGDNLRLTDGKYENFFDIINMDTETQVESLKRLPPPSEFEYILTSHTGIISRDEL